MIPAPLPQQVAAVQADNLFRRLMCDSAWARRPQGVLISDLMFGTPHELAPEALSEALQCCGQPRHGGRDVSRAGDPQARVAIAAALRGSHQAPYEPDDIILTSGAFAALCLALCAVAGPGDEVIVVSPAWFFYETLIAACGAAPVRAPCDPTTFDLDLETIRAALGPYTRAIIINSPHNPTGKIYPPQTLAALADLLSAASAAHGRPITLLSEESYSRVRFDGRPYPSPTTFYPRSVLLYTYGSTLLTPGERLGYSAVSPHHPERERLRQALLAAQGASGAAPPGATLERVLPDIEALSFDMARLQRKRDVLAYALRDLGYWVNSPEGAFYLLVRSPIPDDLAFAERLAEHRVYVLPGAVVGLPGYLRLSLTAGEEMLARALPGFAAALRTVRRSAG